MLPALLAATHPLRFRIVTELLAHPELLIAFIVVWGAVAIVAVAIVAGLFLHRRPPPRG